MNDIVLFAKCVRRLQKVMDIIEFHRRHVGNYAPNCYRCDILKNYMGSTCMLLRHCYCSSLE